MKMPKNVDLSKSINREKVIEPSIANNEKNIRCPPLWATLDLETLLNLFLAVFDRAEAPLQATFRIRRDNIMQNPPGGTLVTILFTDVLSNFYGREWFSKF